ncbi:hypothetical protein DFH06DRAFT_1225238 [Mycena polygramma]|nr:hypothetical protein DFH06DRAFT_1225238 [Mycena polygramma]
MAQRANAPASCVYSRPAGRSRQPTPFYASPCSPTISIQKLDPNPALPIRPPTLPRLRDVPTRPPHPEQPAPASPQPRAPEPPAPRSSLQSQQRIANCRRRRTAGNSQYPPVRPPHPRWHQYARSLSSASQCFPKQPRLASSHPAEQMAANVAHLCYVSRAHALSSPPFPHCS